LIYFNLSLSPPSHSAIRLSMPTETTPASHVAHQFQEGLVLNGYDSIFGHC
jgi:hypothetical protein